VFALCWATASLASAQPAGSSAAALLAQVKTASGGQRWDSVKTISAVGEKTSFGLTGPYRSVEDLAAGRFVRRADYGLFANGEGLDEAGRWRMDNSGRVHPRDSGEARTVAATEAYLAARGYLFPQRAKAALVLEESVVEDGRTFDRIAATPEGGRAVTLWIARSDHRLDRATIALDSRTATIRYRDYRAVDGLRLPFDIATDNGEGELGETQLARYIVDGGSPADTHRPAAGPPDAAIVSGAPVAYAPFRRDAQSGLPVVEARINGEGPLLFILDTGGHDSLTSAAAAMLGLPLHGAGFSLGAGEGSTPTRFTRVASVGLGEAEMRHQPFMVLQLDLGQAMDSANRPTAIAGVIGLELFERFTVTLDYAAGRLSLRLPGPDAIAGGAPIRFTSDLPLVEASIDGRNGWFGLDTGNSTDVILYKAWVEANGLPSWFEVTVDSAGNGVGGALMFRKGRAGAISLAGATLPAPPILFAGDHMGSLSSRAEAGNIGESVLSHYVVTFDYAHETVRLDPPSGAPRP
jgi:hypothetical protein